MQKRRGLLTSDSRLAGFLKFMKAKRAKRRKAQARKRTIAPKGNEFTNEVSKFKALKDRHERLIDRSRAAQQEVASNVERSRNLTEKCRALREKIKEARGRTG